jgi:hypothetical protein
MRTFRAAAVVVAVGLGVFAAGCGSGPTTGGGAGGGDTGKGKPTGTGPGVTAPAAADKAKTAEAEVNKRLDPLKASLDKLKAKLAADEKAVGDDATKVLAVVELRKLKDEAETLVKQIADKVATFKAAKDADLEAAKMAANVMLDKLEPMLKDYK